MAKKGLEQRIYSELSQCHYSDSREEGLPDALMLRLNSGGAVIHFQFPFTGAVFLQDFGWVNAKEKNV